MNKYTNNIDGWMHNSDLEWLYEKAKKMNSIVEIGSWKGRSTHALCSGCKGTVFAVDHFAGSSTSQSDSFSEVDGDNIYKEFMKNCGHFDNMVVLKMPSSYAANELKDLCVDMVFLDGDHSYAGVILDIDLWLPKTTKLICGHDYTGSFSSSDVIEKIEKEGGTFVKKAVDDFFDDVYLTKSGEIWYKEV